MTDRLMRVGLVVLGFPALYTGIWAVVDPHGWFDGYPGLGHHWTSGFGSFNAHLATDTGAGFIAIGVAVTCAAIRMNRTTVRVALLAYLAFSAPHLGYHLVTPEPSVTGLDEILSLALLIAAVAVPVLLLLLSARMRPARFGAGSSPIR